MSPKTKWELALEARRVKSVLVIETQRLEVKTNMVKHVFNWQEYGYNSQYIRVHEVGKFEIAHPSTYEVDYSE